MYDKNFIDILKLINQLSKFKYWISFGSLLGLIRDGKLIDWDDEVDICVRRDQINEDILEILAMEAQSLGFMVTKLRDNYQFSRSGGRKIDLNILQPKIVKGEVVLDLVWDIYFVQTKLHRKIISRLMREIDRCMIYLFLPAWRTFVTKFGYYGQLRYRTKSEWVENTFEYKYGSEIAYLPIGYENLLVAIYGKDWKIPRKSEVWHEFGEKTS